MAEPFAKTFHVRWGDMDFNAHMRNTAYLDVSGDVRMFYFQEHGFPMKEFMSRGIGPVILKDELEYFRELKLLETIRVTLVAAGLSEDGSRFKMRNEFFHVLGDSESGAARAPLVARVTSTGGWLDLKARKMVIPPPELKALLESLGRTADYEALRSAVTKAL